MKKIIFVLALIAPISILTLTAEILLAASTATVSAENSSTTEPQNLQDKIKTLVQESLSATESAVRDRLNQKNLVGYTGIVKSINSDHLSITASDNAIYQITTDKNTVFVKSGSNIKFSSLAISDKLIIIGTSVKEDIILSKRIIVVPPSVESVMETNIHIAKISSVDIKKKTVSLLIADKEVLFTLTKEATRNEAIDLESLKEGDTVIAITKKYEGKDYLSRAKTL